MDIPRQYLIRETNHRIINPFTEEKLALLGRALHPRPGATMLDLCCGKGEMLATWARDLGVTGTGVDVSEANIASARARAADLGVADKVNFIHADARGYVADAPVDIASCIGATSIGGGTAGAIDLLSRSLNPDGLALVGEIYWRETPPDDTTVRACHVESAEDALLLPDLVRSFGDLGWDLVEMVLADEDSWDRYEAGHWLAIRRWLDANPGDALHDRLRDELTSDPLRHVTYRRRFMGWGVFVLMRR